MIVVLNLSLSTLLSSPARSFTPDEAVVAPGEHSAPVGEYSVPESDFVVNIINYVV